MTAPWKQYQIEARDFFRSLGFNAENDVIVHGVRTNHAIDVLVKMNHGGMDIMWIVECKLWSSPVNQGHILALRQIVADLGADRGIILSESGFQSGAIAASNLTNIQCTSLGDLRISSNEHLMDIQLRQLFEEFESCRDIHWNIPKENRIESSAASIVGQIGLSGTLVLNTVNDILLSALNRKYPISIGGFAHHIRPDGTFPSSFGSPDEVILAVKPVMADFRKRLEFALELTRKA